MEEKETSLPAIPTESCDWLANVWNIKTAEKIKLFIWKSLQRALPVGEQFAIRNIPISPLCKRCNEEETILHLFFSCPYAQRVWNLAPLSSTFTIDAGSDYQRAWEKVRKIHSLPPIRLEAGTLASWILWSIWIARNQFGFQNRDFSPEETISKALTDAREWKLAQLAPEPSIAKPLIRSEPSPNREGLTRIFTDAAWNSTTGHTRLGWIFDDLVSSPQQSTTAHNVASPFLAEALAVQAAITSALSRGIETIQILSDSQTLISTINRRSMNLEIFGVLQDIYYLSSTFKTIKFSFVSRSKNFKADTLAKQALWARTSFII